MKSWIFILNDGIKEDKLNQKTEVSSPRNPRFATKRLAIAMCSNPNSFLALYL